jgi:hypothetical protein
MYLNTLTDLFLLRSKEYGKPCKGILENMLYSSPICHEINLQGYTPVNFADKTGKKLRSPDQD